MMPITPSESPVVKRVEDGLGYAATLTARRVSVEGGVMWKGTIAFDNMDYNRMFGAFEEGVEPSIGWNMPGMEPTAEAAIETMTGLRVKLVQFITSYPTLFKMEGI